MFMNPRMLAALALLAPALALAQLPTKEAPKPKPKPAAGSVATVNGVAIPVTRAEFMLQQHQARGAQATEQTRAMVRDELINREVIAQEAQRGGLAKSAEVAAQLDLARQEVLVGAYLRDWVRKNPVTDADVQKEYDRARGQAGEREYRARHILVESEEQAKGLIADLKKGGKFDELAKKNSKDSGSAERGGDLDWNIPAAYDRAFSDAMTKLEKGKHSEAPVRTRFGFHIIQLDDVRPVRFPGLNEVRQRIQQQLVQNKVDELIRGLRAKAKIE